MHAPERELREEMVVINGGGDAGEQREMVGILRHLADAIEAGSNVGEPLLVLEQRCLERLLEAHARAKRAGLGGFD